MPVDYSDMGARIRKLRLKRGMTQEELAQVVGVTFSFIGHIERGYRKVSLEMLVAISNALRTSPDYLLSASLDTSFENYQRRLSSPGQAQVLREVIRTIDDNLDQWEGSLGNNE